jgi:hypothetical protein
MIRPYFSNTIEQLKLEFAENKGNLKLINNLLYELGHRSTIKSKNLMTEIKSFLESQLEHEKAILEPKESEPLHKIEDKDIDTSPVLISTDSTENIISAWTCLEVLSPQTFIKPENLAQNGDPYLISSFKKGALPWEGIGEKSKVNYQLFYHIILGTIKVGESFKMLQDVYGDTTEEKHTRKGEAVLASVIVNNKGMMIEGLAVSISSFAWSLPQALSGRLPQLAKWSTIELKLHGELDSILRGKDNEQTQCPINLDAITNAYQWLIKRLNIPVYLASENLFSVKYYHYYKSSGPPEALLLNSFYLNDLSAAKKLLQDKKSTSNLDRYLGKINPIKRYNLLKDTDALEKSIAPLMMPPARWPGKDRHPLVLLQQSAVNLAFKTLKTDGILPVNGPPGTGKTTLLRDIVAGIVADRAEAMCSFQNPLNAFHTTGQKINVGQAWMHFYELDKTLKGYEMLIASSNNKAVENVSSELPSMSAISSDFPELRFFKSLSDKLHKKDTWGLIAAVLGNGRNKNIFQQTFWWDKENGMRVYLAEASGKPQWIETLDPESGKVIDTRQPKIVTSENAPLNPETALLNWKSIRENFTQLLKASRSKLTSLEKTRELVQSLRPFEVKLIEMKLELNLSMSERDKARRLHEEVLDNLKKITKKQNDNQENRSRHKEFKPGFFAWLFKSKDYKAWKNLDNLYLQALLESQNSMQTMLHAEVQTLKNLEDANKIEKALQNNYRETSGKIEIIRIEIKQAREQLGDHFIGEDFWLKGNKDIHMTSPWCNDEIQRVRDKVFISAMEVHKAFIDASAQKLRHNLSLMMMVLSGKKMPDKAKEDLVPDLWSSLFLTVPVISTTFASIERMLGNVPAESIGWLLIDEAGQALPQAAVGAIMRSKKTVVVGDPIQIEPVVALPEVLTKGIFKYFKVDPDRFNAPLASVQTLADDSSAYFAEFAGIDGVRNVGIPLLVHRRCTEPMFSISNEVAYNKEMVQAKVRGNSKIRNLLGRSKWIQVEDHSLDKWSEKEGEVVIQILKELKIAGLQPDIYIISPFLIVAENLRKLLINSGVLNGWVEDSYLWTTERVGTVHTVQGREAEAVIFVLGAPSQEQNGARRWAGSTPNILNVAITRAKEAIYVVGNRSHWKSAGLFSQLVEGIPE